MRDPGAIKPDESVLNVLREIPVGECRLTEMLNSIYFLQEHFCSFFDEYIQKNITEKNVILLYYLNNK